ncbi:MAG: GNAT family N-acetyltransferase [Roseobacter sp.]
MFDQAPIATSPRALQQSDGFAQALGSLSTPPLRLDDGTLVLRRKFGPLPLRMIVRPDAKTPQEMRALLRQLPGRAPIVISPEHPMPLDTIGAIPLVSPTHTATLDLSLSLTNIRAGFHQKWRNRLVHAEKQDLRIKRQNMPDDPGHWLLEADRAQQLKRGYRSWPDALTLAFARENRGDAKLFTAFWGRLPIAGILILRHGDAATYHIGHMKPSSSSSSAHNLLIWNAIIWAKSKSIVSLELGTITTEDAPGLARFKLGTGAISRALGGTWLWWPPVTSILRPAARFDKRLMQLV